MTTPTPAPAQSPTANTPNAEAGGPLLGSYVPVRQIAGTVLGIWGEAVLRLPDGSVVPLKVGDVVRKGDVVLTTQDGIVQLEPLRQAAGEIDRVIEQVAQGDPATAPAAGLQGGEGDSLLPGVRVERVAEGVSPAGLLTDGPQAPTATAVSDTPAPDDVVVADATPDTPDPADAQPDTFATDEDTALVFDPRGNDSGTGTLTVTEIDGQPIEPGTPVAVTDGTVTLNPDGTLTFTPDPDFSGTVDFPYTAVDEDGRTVTSTVSIVVNPVNDAPAAADDNATTPEDTPVVIDVLANDDDAEGNPLTITAINGLPIAIGSPVTLPEGVVSLNDDGTLTFTPAEGFNGDLSFSYTVTDGTTPVTAQVDVTVTPVNDPPVAVADTVTTAEDTPVTVDVRGNDRDPDGDPLTVSAVTQGANGTVTIDPVSGNPVYTPNPDFTGSDTFTYTVTDPSGATSTTTVTVTIGAVNDAPVARPDTGTTPEDTPISGNVIDNDRDVDSPRPVLTGFSVDIDGDGAPETFAPGQTAAIAGVGTITLGSDGGYTFTPAPDYAGPVPVVGYTIADTDGDTAQGTLTLTVEPRPDATITLDANITADDILSSAEAGQDIPVTGTVGADVKPGDTVTLTIGGQTFTGTVQPDLTFSIDVPGSVLASDPDRTIDASVTTTDAAGNTATATDTESYTVDGAPTIDLDGGVAGTGYDTLFNENGAPVSLAALDLQITDPDGTTLQGATVRLTNGQPGDVLQVGTLPPGITATISGDTVVLSGAASADAYEAALRAITFSAPGNDPDATPRTVEITVNDGVQDSNTAVATVSVNTVEPANDPRTAGYSVSLGNFAADDGWTGVDSTGQPVDILAFNADGSTGSLFTFDTTNPVTDNSLGVAGTTRGVSTGVPGQIEHDRQTGQSESIVVQLNGLCNTASFDVASMNPTEDGGEGGRWVAMYQGEVVATGEFRTTPPDSSARFTIDTGDLVFDSIRFEATPTGNNTQTLDGSDYYLSGLQASGPADVNGAYTTAENAVLTVPAGSADTLLANDADPDGDSFTLSAVNGQPAAVGQTITLASGALLTVNADGSFSYDPNGAWDSLDAGEVARESFTYTVTDARGASDTATATVTIVGAVEANAPPVAANDSFTAAEDTPLTLVPNQLLGNDRDPDADPITIVSVQNAVNGTVALVNGNVVFTPAPDYNGPASFTYTISDGQGGTSTATVDLSIESRPDASITLDANITADDIISAAERQQTVTITGTVGADVKPGDTVTLTIAGVTYTGAVAEGGTFAIGVAGNDLVRDGDRTIQASVTTTDANGNTATATDTETYTVSAAVPGAQDGSAVTAEDTPYVFAWSDFRITDADGGPREEIIVRTLPADGRLQVFDGAAWVDVASGDTVTRAQVDTGAFRFVPDANESGDDSYGGSGVGNQQADYARFTFAPSDGINTGGTRRFTLDVTPEADAPVVSASGSSVTLPPFAPADSRGLRWDWYDELEGADRTTAAVVANVEAALEADGSPSQSGLLTNVYLAGSSPGMPAPGTGGDDAQGGQTQTRYSDTDDANRVSGFIWLEAGRSYTVSGFRDDTLAIEIGGTPVFDEGHNRWGAFTAATYTPAVSGYYSLDIVYYNGDGAGGLDLNLSVDGGAAQNLSTLNFVLLEDAGAVESTGIPGSAFVPVGTDGGGYYTVPDTDASAVALPIEVGAALTDTDGSETLALTLDGVPAGFTVSDGTRSLTASGDPLTLTGWDLDGLTVRATPGFEGTRTLTLTATATESNGDTATTTQAFTLTYTETAAQVTPADPAVTSGAALDLRDLFGHEAGGALIDFSRLPEPPAALAAAARAPAVADVGAASQDIGHDLASIAHAPAYGGVDELLRQTHQAAQHA